MRRRVQRAAYGAHALAVALVDHEEAEVFPRVDIEVVVGHGPGFAAVLTPCGLRNRVPRIKIVPVCST